MHAIAVEEKGTFWTHTWQAANRSASRSFVNLLLGGFRERGIVELLRGGHTHYTPESTHKCDALVVTPETTGNPSRRAPHARHEDVNYCLKIRPQQHAIKEPARSRCVISVTRNDR